MSNYNRTIDFKLTNDGTVTEPVTLATAKLYARAQTGTTEDDLFNMFITSARMAIEKLTGLSLIAKTAKITFEAPVGMFSLPHGPVKASPAPVYKDSQNNVITPTVLGYDYPVIQDELNGVNTAEYSVGFSNVPEELKVALLDQVVFLYENRGDNSDTATVCSKAQKICQRYSRIAFFS
jgi:hypothetical protein